MVKGCKGGRLSYKLTLDRRVTPKLAHKPFAFSSFAFAWLWTLAPNDPALWSKCVVVDFVIVHGQQVLLYCGLKLHNSSSKQTSAGIQG